MKKLLVGAVAALGLVAFSGSASAETYAAIAASQNGSAYVEGYSTMEGARRAAKRRCQQTWGGSCSMSVAERSSWYYAAGDCDGQVYVGATSRGWARAEEIVRIKASRDGYYNCRMFANN